jgi:hypothetical protein
MALKFEVDQEAFDQLDEGQQALYDKHGDGYRLQVEGIDPADELKEALRKEREERAEAKRKLQEFESEAEKRERERLEKQQEYETLYQREQEGRSKIEKELAELRDKVANGERTATAEGVVAGLIDKEATGGVQRYGLLKKEALQFIAHTPDGVKINGPDGEAWDAKQLGRYLSDTYPFLVDGSKATGGGAPGSKGGGAVTKKFNEMSGAELSALRQEDPQAYQRLRDEYHNR